MSNDFTERLRVWKSEGWSMEITGGNHIRLTHPDASKPVFCAKTPSDVRARKNVESLLRKALGKPETTTIPEISKPARKTKTKSTASQKHPKFFIRYENIIPETDNEEPVLSLFDQANSKLRADVWRLNYLRLRLEDREISTIHALRKRFRTDDKYFKTSLASFRTGGIVETNKIREILRERGRETLRKIREIKIQEIRQAAMEETAMQFPFKTFDQDRKVVKRIVRTRAVSSNGIRRYG